VRLCGNTTVFTDLFPDMTISELTQAAEQAGYHEEVLDPPAAANMPRSVVGR
jgi:hypothetical protein